MLVKVEGLLSGKSVLLPARDELAKDYRALVHQVSAVKKGSLLDD